MCQEITVFNVPKHFILVDYLFTSPFGGGCVDVYLDKPAAV